jgi:hypothetical protein
MNKTKTQILTIIATILTIAVNAAANILPLNGVTTAEVSNTFTSFFVPAGYVFAIWGVIYILLIIFSFGFSVVPKKEREYVEEIVPWYILGSIVNIVWIFSWHYGFFLTTLVAMLTLLITLIATQMILNQNKAKSLTEQVIVHLPFNVYLGWVSVATIANVADVLSYFGFTGFGINGAYWAAAMMLVSGALAALVIMKSNKAFGIVVIWALIGIMVKFPTELSMLIAGSLAVVFTVGVLVYKQFFVKKAKK